MADLGQNKIYKFVKDVEVATGKLVTYETHPSFSADTELVDKKYVDDAIAVEDLWDRAGHTLIPHNNGDIVKLELVSSLDEMIFETQYAIDADGADGICYSGFVWGSVPTFSGQKISFRALIETNAGDGAATEYIGFLADSVIGTTASRTAFEAEDNYSIALKAASGAMIESVSSTQSIVAGTGIADVEWKNILVESSTAGDTTVTANPAIATLGVGGQSIRVIGTDDVKTVTFNHGNGLSLDNGEPITLGENDTLDLVYIGTTWLETGRCIKI